MDLLVFHSVFVLLNIKRNAPVVINPLLPVAPRKVFRVSNRHRSRYALTGEDIGQGLHYLLDVGFTDRGGITTH